MFANNLSKSSRTIDSRHCWATSWVTAAGAASAVKISFVVALTTVSRWRFLARYLDAMSGAVVPHHYFDHVGERPVFTCWEC